MKITYMIITCVICSVLLLSPSETKSLSMDTPVQTVSVQAQAMDIYKDISNKTALISAYNKSELIGTGTGVVIKKNTIVTCLHVVEKANKVILDINGKQLTSTKIVTKSKFYDLAIIEVDIDIEPVKISDKAIVGEDVFCIANPRGFKTMITKGTLSGYEKYFERTYIVTDTESSKGSSGGGVYNKDGELLGIVQFNFTDTPNFIFVLPVDTVLKNIKG